MQKVLAGLIFLLLGFSVSAFASGTAALDALEAEEVVTTEVQMNNYSRAVYEAVKKYGFEFNEPVVVRLVDEKTLAEASKTSGAAGLARIVYRNMSGSKKLISAEILLKSGFSVSLFQRHLANELGHVWIHQQGNDGLDRVFEEGSCEALSFIAVYEIGAPDAASIMRSIETNPDSIYGAGFRIVKDFIMQHGMADWRNQIAGHKLDIWAENTFPSTPSLAADPIAGSIASVENNLTVPNVVTNLPTSDNNSSSALVSTTVVVQELGNNTVALDQRHGTRLAATMRFLLAWLLIVGVISFSVWARYAS